MKEQKRRRKDNKRREKERANIADNEDDMIDEITAASGWLIKNIYYEIQLK